MTIILSIIAIILLSLLILALQIALIGCILSRKVLNAIQSSGGSPVSQVSSLLSKTSQAVLKTGEIVLRFLIYVVKALRGSLMSAFLVVLFLVVLFVLLIVGAVSAFLILFNDANLVEKAEMLNDVNSAAEESTTEEGSESSEDGEETSSIENNYFAVEVNKEGIRWL